MADPGFGLYVHWPFCQSKCPYCDFNSHVGGSVDASAWLKAYLAELTFFADMVEDRVLSSIFFGGGTPSLMEPSLVEGIISGALSRFRSVNDIEITLEANPTSVDASRFQGYRTAGVNRLSVGVQALNDEDLRLLGRLHSVDDALAAVDLAGSLFDRSSFDLIYARQNQSLIQWESELSRALSLANGHLSLYQLTIEEGTPFFARRAAGGLCGLPGEDLQADMFELTRDLCEAAGYPAYEISNHAKPGHESRHNLTYWRSGEWIGIGPGAHGRLNPDSGRVATACQMQPALWMDQVARKGHGCISTEALSPVDIDVETLMMGLRIAEGVDLRRLRVLDISAPCQDLRRNGLVHLDGDILRVSRSGRPLLNAILGEILTVAP